MLLWPLNSKCPLPTVMTKFALGAILQADEVTINSLVKSQSGDAIDNGKDKQQPCPTPDANGKKEETTAGGGEDSSEKEAVEDHNPTNRGSSWDYIKGDPKLRASLCTAMLYGGYPCSPTQDKFMNVSAELRLELNRNPAHVPPIPFSCLSSPVPMTGCPFFSMEDAFSPVFKRAEIDWSDKAESVNEYLQSVLLPHCLKLCLTLAAEQTKNAKDQGNTDVYLGRSPVENLSPLPDPFVPIEDHSEEAMAHAYATLRRTRLMKSIRFIVGGGVELNVLISFLRGSFWRSQANGIPVWWCPWIHDLGLLTSAALYGLGSIATVLPLQQSKIEQHVRETFVEGTAGSNPALPKSFLDSLSKDEVDMWFEMHSKQFPTFHVVEHRLALICSHLTLGTDAQYDNIPMFDEGGWPMVEDVTATGLLADTRTSGTRCMLSDFVGGGQQ